jgi:D-glycero-alpha-D-manno-heptose-7-phosphate kinase
MIITRTPYRVSFFGGGTDLKPWYSEYGGAVLTSTIDKYCYICARYMPAFLGSKYRVFWSKMETVDRVEDIQHPGVRACLQYLGVDEGFEVNHCGDLPARAGLGSSSAFTVGMLYALYTLRGYHMPKEGLAGAAVHVEQEVLKETVGIQDQIQCAIGGLNVIRIARSGDWDCRRVEVSPETMSALEGRLMLFWTGLQRTSSAIAADTVAALPHSTDNMSEIQWLVDEAVDKLYKKKLNVFGELLHEAWIRKQRLSPLICTPEIFNIYEAARHAGSLGGKLLGAGGGGFMLLYTPPDRQQAVRQALTGLLEVPFRFETEGTRLVLS